MSTADLSLSKSQPEILNVEFIRSLVKQYSELGQWTSALFWADAAAAVGNAAGAHETAGDDIWLLASTMLARGELHRAAHTVTIRNLHKRHVLCLGVAMRAMLTAKDPNAVLSLVEECDPNLLEPRNNDQTHNRALASVLLTRARALCELDRRDAAAESLAGALRADTACYEALDLLLERHSLSPSQEKQLLDSLPVNSQLCPGEAALVRAAYEQRVQRYYDPPCEISKEVELVRSLTSEAMCARARRMAATCEWEIALQLLNAVDPWCCPDVRAACLVELRKSTELFTFAHTLVDAYPQSWTSWFAVGCYYYLIGKSEFARRYLSKAKSFEPSAGCVWLTYGHSFAADNEHDQAMAAYFKASQLMAGCHLPPLYVGVECTLLNNVDMAEMFLGQAAELFPCKPEQSRENRLGILAKGGFDTVLRVAGDAHVAHEAGAAAFAAKDFPAAEKLFLRALVLASPCHDTHSTSQLSSRWAATMDALGHVARRRGRPAEALAWHERALATRPRRASSLTAAALCRALLRQEVPATDLLHAALSIDPDYAVAQALLVNLLNKFETPIEDEDIPQFQFPAITLPVPTPPSATKTDDTVGSVAPADATNVSDMSMSFD